MDRENRLKKIEAAITCTKDFPKPGILFRDVFGVFRDPCLTKMLMEELIALCEKSVPKETKIDVVVALDARGFLFGPTIAMHFNASMVPLRKVNKLPGKCHQTSYTLEYGTATIEIQADAISPGQNVLIVDDLVATGGSLEGAVKLIQQCQANPVGAVSVIELAFLKARDRLTTLPFLHSLFTY